jgi:methylated-DNA-[protein]-cysteine S-methyltransferase
MCTVTERTFRGMNSSTTFLIVDTPVGRLVLEGAGDVLVGVRLPNDLRETPISDVDPPPVLRKAAAQLEEYFDGRRTEFDVPVGLDGTPFQRQVWTELRRIPYGQTISYGELARRVGRPTGPRAVGQANGKNPIPILVPCHRVVAGNGMGGYAGGLPVKQALLTLEGAGT